VVPNPTCNPDGTRTVTFNVTITDTSGSNAVAQWTFDSNVPTSKGNLLIISPLGIQPDTETYNYYPASNPYTATLTIALPLGCLPIDVPVNVQECPPYCPQLSDVTVTVGDCKDGKRDVTFTFSTTLTVDIDFGDGSDSFSLTGESVT